MQHQRRYDLDWLRVIAFALLILYHIGMFYVPWSWHVKSGHAPVDALQLPMILMSSWRLPLLFFVSGVAVRFALDKTPHTTFLPNRLYRLLIPLLFGMWVICAPQAYYELTQSGQFNGSVLEFYRGYATMPWASPSEWSIITPTWNHLWYLLYVLVYTLLIALTSWFSNRRFEAALETLAERALRFPDLSLIAVLPALFMLILYVFAASYGAQQTLWGDWHNLTASLLTMLLGYVFAKNEAFWDYLKHRRWAFLMLALISSAAVTIGMQKDLFATATHAVVRIIHCWSVLYTLLGFSQVFLNKDSAVLRYLSAAIFPYYVLHQTLIIVVGIALSSLGYSLFIESGLLLVLTFLGCAIFYHLLIRRMGWWGVLFGAAPVKKN